MYSWPLILARILSRRPSQSLFEMRPRLANVSIYIVYRGVRAILKTFLQLYKFK